MSSQQTDFILNPRRDLGYFLTYSCEDVFQPLHRYVFEQIGLYGEFMEHLEKLLT